MIVAMFSVYLVLLFVMVRLGIVRFNLFWKVSPLIVLLLLMIGLFIPMGWGAPQGAALVVRNSVADRARRRRRGDRGSGRREYAAQGWRRAVPDRSDALSRRRSRPSRRN